MLFTKLHIPGITQNYVFRKHIFEKLNEGYNKKVILISAPAGYGKTSALVDWIKRENIPTAWYSLDESDNSLNLFLNYVVAGLQTVDKSIGVEIQQSLKSNIEIPVETITDILVSDILESGKEILLVWDDFHLINDNKIIQFIRYFLDYKPENLTLSFITRSDPPIQVSKLRSKQKLIEIRSEDLKFSAGDINEFFHKAHDIILSEIEINSLLTKTEGWISGLHLAGISIQAQESVSTFIENFKGNNRYIMDYLMDEVLSSMNNDLKEFLLKTSILERMCPPLCDYILHSQNSVEQLLVLEKNNLFIVPLDNEREWYRYHHLFSDLLKKRLKHSSSINIPELHTLAGEWLINNNLVDEAIRHLLLAKNYQKAAELISREMSKIWDDGNHFRFSPWLKSLPEHIVNEIPQLIILKAEIAMVSWEIESAKLLLKNAADLLSAIEKQKCNPLITLSDKEIKNFKGRILVNYGLIASFDNNTEDILKYADEALEALSKDQVMLRNLALMNKGDAYFYDGRLNKAYEVQLEINKSSQIAQNSFLYLISGSYLATTLRHQGKLDVVLELCNKHFTYGIDNGLKYTTSIGWLQIQKGEVLAEFNELEEAEKIATQGIETARKSKIVSGLLKGYLLLIRIFFSAKKYSEIEKVLEKIKTESSGHGNTKYNKNQIDAWKIRISISQKQFDEVEQWLKEYENQEDIIFDYINENKHITASRAYIAFGKIKEAEELLEHVEIEAKEYERINSLIEINILKTLMEDCKGEIEKAKKHLYKALIIAEPGGYIRSFVDEGPVIEEVIKNLHKDIRSNFVETKNEVSKEYISQIVRGFSNDKKKNKQSDDDLSNRELEILKLISQKLSNKEIGETLFISLPTVKTHVSNILLKLEAENRIKATEIAREKGII